MTANWIADNTHKDKLNELEAKFILEHAEKQLKDSIDTSQIIVSRSTTLLSIISGIQIALISFVLKNVEECNFSSITKLGIITLIWFLYLSFKLASNLQGKNYHILGKEPKDMMNNDFFEEDNHTINNNRLKSFYLAEIEDYQNKIEYNKNLNILRWYTFNNCLYKLLFSPIIFIVIYFILRLLNYR